MGDDEGQTFFVPHQCARRNEANLIPLFVILFINTYDVVFLLFKKEFLISRKKRVRRLSFRMRKGEISFIISFFPVRVVCLHLARALDKKPGREGKRFSFLLMMKACLLLGCRLLGDSSETLVALYTLFFFLVLIKKKCIDVLRRATPDVGEIGWIFRA